LERLHLNHIGTGDIGGTAFPNTGTLQTTKLQGSYNVNLA